MIHSMLNLVKKIETPITFPVRACHLRSSYATLQPLLRKPNHTITIWNGETASSNLKDWLKHNLDHDKFFCDLIDDNGNPLEL